MGLVGLITNKTTFPSVNAEGLEVDDPVHRRY